MAHIIELTEGDVLVIRVPNVDQLAVDAADLRSIFGEGIGILFVTPEVDLATLPDPA